MSAGFVDAGSASLATFTVAIYASRVLVPESLGIYALFFSAFAFAMLITTQLPYTPIEIHGLNFKPEVRPGLVFQSVRLAILPTFASLAVVACAWLLAPASASRELVRIMAVTTAATTILSPVQDHVRRLLHLSFRSWDAAAISVVQLLVTAVATLLIHLSPLAPEWTPFGALAIANTVSLGFGLLTCHRRRTEHIERIRFGQLGRSGGWLLVQAFASNGAAFAVSAIVARVIGTAQLGYAEAARIVAQPMFVFFVGISASLGPRSMEAAAAFDRTSARRIALKFNAAVVGCGAIYALTAGLPWAWNPVAHVIPLAFTVPGLTLVSIVAEVGRGVSSPYRSELLGARRESNMALIEGIGGGLRLLTTVGAPILQAFVVPVGFLVSNVSRIVGSSMSLMKHYRPKSVGVGGNEVRRRSSRADATESEAPLGRKLQ